MKKKTPIFVFIFLGAMAIVFFASYSLSGFLVDKHKSEDTNTKKNNAVDISPTPNNTNTAKTKDEQSSQETSTPEEKPNVLEPYTILGVSNKLSEKEKSAMAVWRDKIVKLAKKNAGAMVISGSSNKKMVALTFDDGPDAKITPKVLDVLKQNDVKGNFFFIGEKVGQNKDVVKRAFSDGNLVLSHSFNHPDLSTKSEADIDKQIKDTENAIFNVIGKKPALIRPPYGETNDAVLKEASRNDLRIIIWSIDTLDWSQREKDNITKNVLDNVRPGEIILMHSNEDKKVTLEALPDIISGLKAKGYSIVTLSEMLGVNAYKD
jgi:peptidoglycan/xylan/chitin deacetylase (PgdA/CDA1 family)